MCRQVDQVEQQSRQAHQAAQQACDSLEHIEAHVAGLTRQLYHAQQEQRNVHLHYEVRYRVSTRPLCPQMSLNTCTTGQFYARLIYFVTQV